MVLYGLALAGHCPSAHTWKHGLKQRLVALLPTLSLQVWGQGVHAGGAAVGPHHGSQPWAPWLHQALREGIK